MRKKFKKPIVVIMLLMLVTTMIPTASFAAVNGLSTASWPAIASKVKAHKKGMSYQQAGKCSGYVISNINANYGINIGSNTTVVELEKRIVKRGATRVETNRTSGTVSSNMKPGDILIFKMGSKPVHCGILGENGMLYHNRTRKGVSAQKLSEWMKYPDAEKGCDRYSVYRGLVSNGQLSLKKVSTNPSLSGNNDCYSLSGATYKVYDSAKKEVATLVTNENGVSNSVELPAGTYTVKETVAPNGFWLDNTVHKITVRSGSKAVIKASDKPAADPVVVMLRKYNSETGDKYTAPDVKKNFGASLENAHYEFKYYDIPSNIVTQNGGINSDTFKDFLKDKTPKNMWTFKTNKNGFCYYDNEHKVSGGELYYDDTGIPILPLGVYTIQEVKAPDGFKIDNTLHVRQIEKLGSTATVWSDNEPKAPEDMKRGDLSFTKIDGKTQNTMANIPFKLSAKSNNETHYLMTDKNGQASTASSWNKHVANNTLDGLTPETGIWFGETSAMNDSLGALPFDTYSLINIYF